MKNKKLIFDSTKIFNSLKKIFLFDRRNIFIFLILSIILSGLSSIYFEEKKKTRLEIKYSYRANADDLSDVEIISSKSFDIFLHQNNPAKDLLHSDSIDFPSFTFNLDKTDKITTYERIVDDILKKYVDYLTLTLSRKIEFVSERSEDNNLDLQYTLFALKNNPIFYNKIINIIKPDNIYITFLKIAFLIFVAFFTMRLFYLIIKNRIKLT